MVAAPLVGFFFHLLIQQAQCDCDTETKRNNETFVCGLDHYNLLPHSIDNTIIKRAFLQPLFKLIIVEFLCSVQTIQVSHTTENSDS